MECSSWQQHVACLMCGLSLRYVFDALSWMHAQLPHKCNAIRTCVIGVFNCMVFLLRPHSQICVFCMYRLFDCGLAVLSACFIISGHDVIVAFTHVSCYVLINVFNVILLCVHLLWHALTDWWLIGRICIGSTAFISCFILVSSGTIAWPHMLFTVWCNFGVYLHACWLAI